MQSAFKKHEVEIPQHLDTGDLERFGDVFWDRYVAEAERAYGHRAEPFFSLETHYAGESKTETNRVVLIQRHTQSGVTNYLENRDNTHSLNAAESRKQYVYQSRLGNGAQCKEFCESLCLQPVQQFLRRGVYLKGKDEGVTMEVYQTLDVLVTEAVWGEITVGDILVSGKAQLFEGNNSGKITVLLDVLEAQDDKVEDNRLIQAAKLIKIEQ